MTDPVPVLNTTAVAVRRVHYAIGVRKLRKPRTMSVLLLHPVTLCGAGRRRQAKFWQAPSITPVDCPRCRSQPVEVMGELTGMWLSAHEGVELAMTDRPTPSLAWPLPLPPIPPPPTERIPPPPAAPIPPPPSRSFRP